MGPPINASRATTAPMARPAVPPCSCDSAETLLLRSGRDAQNDEHQHGGEQHFKHPRLHGRAARNGGSQRGIGGKQKMNDDTCQDGSAALAQNVRNHETTGEPFCTVEANRDRRIDVCARHVAQRGNHRKDDESECERDPQGRNRSTAVNDDRRCSGKHEAESPNGLGDEFLLESNHTNTPFSCECEWHQRTLVTGFEKMPCVREQRAGFLQGAGPCGPCHRKSGADSLCQGRQ